MEVKKRGKEAVGRGAGRKGRRKGEEEGRLRILSWKIVTRHRMHIIRFKKIVLCKKKKTQSSLFN